MKQNKRLWIIMILSLTALSLLLSATACDIGHRYPIETTDEESAPPADTPDSTDQETEAPPEEIGDPYELVFTSNGDGTCKVSDIIVNFRYHEKFDLTIPATSPVGERVVAVENPDGFGYVNVPRVMLLEDYESLKYFLGKHYGKDSFTVQRFESYYRLRDVDACSTEALKQDLLTA